VIAAPASIVVRLARSRNELGGPFREIFDEALVTSYARLAGNPTNLGAKVDFITTYHLSIESTLGPTALEFSTRYLNTNQLLPGVVDGYSHIHHDEQRQIGYCVWYLREAAHRDPALAEPIRTKFRELLPAVATALAPPNHEDTD
jgi:ribonucleoside-diphosphate reductase beta chain